MSDMEKKVCRLCFAQWLTGKKPGEPAATMTGAELLKQPYAFDTDEELKKHLEEAHNIIVTDG